jgi:hypothetical protein
MMNYFFILSTLLLNVNLVLSLESNNLIANFQGNLLVPQVDSNYTYKVDLTKKTLVK